MLIFQTFDVEGTTLSLNTLATQQIISLIIQHLSQNLWAIP